MTEMDDQLGLAADLAVTLRVMTYSCPCRFGEGDRYELIEMIGSGHSEVYSAIDSRLSTDGHPFRVAIKLRNDDQIDEAQSGAAVQHPNVAQVLDAAVWMGRAYIVQELVEGATLDECSLDAGEMIGAIADVADGLQALHHAGIAHNDVKPRNIVLDSGGTPRLIDLDVATPVNEKPGGYTDAFRAPEIGRAAGSRCTPASDIYALAKTLEAVLDGRDAPSDVARIIARATASDPQNRHTSASEFASDLRGVLAHKTLPWATYTPLVRATRWARRNPVRLAVAALVLVAAVSASIAGVSTIRHQQQRLVLAEAAQQLADEQQRATDARLRDAMRAISQNLRHGDRSNILRQMVYLDALGVSDVLGPDGTPLIGAAKIEALTGLLEGSPADTIDGMMVRYALAFLLIERAELGRARAVIDTVALDTLRPDDPTRIGFEVMGHLCNADLDAAVDAAEPLVQYDHGDALAQLVAKIRADAMQGDNDLRLDPR